METQCRDNCFGRLCSSLFAFVIIYIDCTSSGKCYFLSRLLCFPLVVWGFNHLKKFPDQAFFYGVLPYYFRALRCCIFIFIVPPEEKPYAVFSTLIFGVGVTTKTLKFHDWFQLCNIVDRVWEIRAKAFNSSWGSARVEPSDPDQSFHFNYSVKWSKPSVGRRLRSSFEIYRSINPVKVRAILFSVAFDQKLFSVI